MSHTMCLYNTVQSISCVAYDMNYTVYIVYTPHDMSHKIQPVLYEK